MVLQRRNPFRLCLLIFLVISGTHCARDNKNDGTQDSGGGVVINSTKEEVNAALDLALNLATEPDMKKNVFVQFWKDWGQRNENEFIRKPVHLFSVAETTAKSGGEISPNERFESPYLMALNKNKINRVETDCLASIAGKHTDASVSSLSIGADVCFSIQNLMRIPRASLLREILSLALHEASHMGGADEPEAIAWQELFSAYFGARFGDLSTDIIAAETLKTLGVARIFLARARELAARNSEDPRLFAQMGKFVQALDSLPELGDPLAFNLKLKPKYPERIEHYSNSVHNLIREIRLKFEINTDYLRVKGITVPLRFMPPEAVLQSLSEISISFEKINEEFLVMAGRADFATPVCRNSGQGTLVQLNNDDSDVLPPMCDQEL